jgi:hypothetical protein
MTKKGSDANQVRSMEDAHDYLSSTLFNADIGVVSSWNSWEPTLKDAVENVYRTLALNSFPKLKEMLDSAHKRHNISNFRSRWGNVTLLLFALFSFFAGSHALRLVSSFLNDTEYKLVEFNSVVAVGMALVICVYYLLLKRACNKRARYWHALNRLRDTAAKVMAASSKPDDLSSTDEDEELLTDASRANSDEKKEK